MVRLAIFNEVHCESGRLFLGFFLGAQLPLDVQLADAERKKDRKVWIVLVLVDLCDKRCSGLDWLLGVVSKMGCHLCSAGVALCPWSPWSFVITCTCANSLVASSTA